MGAAKNEIGNRYGRLIVVARAVGDGPRWWACECDCGGKKDVRGTLLRNGETASCGCLHRERSSAAAKATHTRHGQSSGDRRGGGYRCWEAMKDRCQNRASRSFPKWGGRGITVTDRWSTFEQFISDMGPRPSPKHTLDRIDNCGNYEPSNCRWALPVVQMRNRRNNLHLTAFGRTMLLVEWADETGINYFAMRERVRAGWSPERVVTEPSRRHASRRKMIANGEGYLTRKSA